MTPMQPVHVHGTAIAIGNAAALIRGKSGSGKSDLALRCVCMPQSLVLPDAAKLVADDQVIVTRTAGGVYLSSPPSINGSIEVRGVGIVAVPAISKARLVLVADLTDPSQVDRMPEQDFCLIEGIRFACTKIAPFEASAALKLMLCLQHAALQNP
jgi:HPr kinase/phosphorylase